MAFVVTAMGLVASMLAVQRQSDGSTVTSAPLMEFFDRRGEELMLAEAATIAVACAAAMALDRWTSWKADRRKKNSPEEKD